LTRARLSFAILPSLLALGCTAPLPAASFVDKLRVLAVRAEPPELAPGETAALDLLAVAPRVAQDDAGAPRKLDVAWLACALPPGAATIAPCAAASPTSLPPSCRDAPHAPVCLVALAPTASYAAPADALGGAASAEVILTVAVADDDAGALGCLANVAANGGVQSDTDHCVIAIKRLQLSDPARRQAAANANPALADFTLTSPAMLSQPLDGDGAAWVYAPGRDKAAWDLVANRASDAAQQKSDGTFEQLTVSWYTTAGAIDGDLSYYLPSSCSAPGQCPTLAPELGADTTWFAPTAGEAAGVVGADGVVQFWAVLRDDRGGVGWRSGAATLAR
jgi:hypothetical protein